MTGRLKKALLGGVLIYEFCRYCLSQNTKLKNAGFTNYLDSRLRRRSLPVWSIGSLALMVANKHFLARSYLEGLNLLRSCERYVPWLKLSVNELRKYFEIALIFGDHDVATWFGGEVCHRATKDNTAEKLAWLMLWRFTGLIREEASKVDTNLIFFIHYPDYDAYFKGCVSELTNHTKKAARYFELAISLAPKDAIEFREAINSRSQKSRMGA